MRNKTAVSCFPFPPWSKKKTFNKFALSSILSLPRTTHSFGPSPFPPLFRGRDRFLLSTLSFPPFSPIFAHFPVILSTCGLLLLLLYMRRFPEGTESKGASKPKKGTRTTRRPRCPLTLPILPRAFHPILPHPPLSLPSPTKKISSPPPFSHLLLFFLQGRTGERSALKKEEPVTIERRRRRRETFGFRGGGGGGRGSGGEKRRPHARTLSPPLRRLVSPPSPPMLSRKRERGGGTCFRRKLLLLPPLFSLSPVRPREAEGEWGEGKSLLRKRKRDRREAKKKSVVWGEREREREENPPLLLQAVAAAVFLLFPPSQR